MIKALTIRGPYRGISGYDHDVREFVRALSRRGVRIELHDLAHWSPDKLPAQKRETWFDTLNRPVDARVVLHFCMPHQAHIVKGKLNVNFTMFEASRVIKKWVKANRRHDLVILPTEACQQAWIRSGLPAEKIRLCPLGVNTDQFRPDAKPLMLGEVRGQKVEAYRTRILNVSDLTPRKNLSSLLKVWIKATDRHDDALLIVKLNCRSPIWLAEFRKEIEGLQAELGKSKSDAAPILFLMNRLFSSAEMPGLFAATTHCWSMSHGEGWDLPMMEAAATGLHIMAPNHSAYPTYLSPALARLIPARQIPAVFTMSDGTHKLFRGADWWEADEDVAATYLRQAIDNPVTQRNHQLRESMVQGFTWDQAAERLMNILSDVEAQSEPRHANHSF